MPKWLQWLIDLLTGGNKPVPPPTTTTPPPPLTTTLPPPLTTTPSPAPSILQQLLDAHNEQRRLYGLPTILLSKELCTAAQGHTEWMARTNNMGHVGEGGSTFITRISRAGYTGFATGENIAAGYRTVNLVVQDWMASPGHRRNILNAQSNEVGFGLASASDGTQYWTTDFGASRHAIMGEQAPECHLPGPMYGPEWRG